MVTLPPLYANSISENMHILFWTKNEQVGGAVVTGQ